MGGEHKSRRGFESRDDACKLTPERASWTRSYFWIEYGKQPARVDVPTVGKKGVNCSMIMYACKKRWMAGVAAMAFISALLPTAMAGNGLSKEEIAEGWINLFDGETLFGWNSLGDVQWSIADGAIAGENGSGGWIFTTSQFANFELDAKVRVKGDYTMGLAVRAGLEGHPSENGSTIIALEGADDGNEWLEIHVVADGATIEATVNGQRVEGLAQGRGDRHKGHIGLLYYEFHGDRRFEAKVELAQAKLRPLHMHPLFNGKDLSGWTNPFPDKPSVFSVVDDAINIKDGNGQIETERILRDFVLQLDIIGHGAGYDPDVPDSDSLNSGVFYRGVPGVFWKGYESQVKNRWNDRDRTKPYDWGTGGNYGNQPARKVVSTEGQWFKKTVVCNGNENQVWIDGYLVSDFLDMRPVQPGNDAKNGYVPGPGTIHLQGHDPTTDLSFKNIKIQVHPNR